MVLLSVNISLSFNAYAQQQQGGAAQSGAATGGAAQSGAATGGAAQSGAATTGPYNFNCTVAGACSFGGPTSGPATGGAATSGSAASNNSAAKFWTSPDTYQNARYGITMQYPSDWITQNGGAGNIFPVKLQQYGIFAKFDSPQRNSEGYYITEVRLGARELNNDSSSLSQDMKNHINYLRKVLSAQVVNSNTSATLGGQPAYKFVYEFTPMADKFIAVAMGTVVGSKMYYLQAIIEAYQYSNYIPIVEQMINSYTLPANSGDSSTSGSAASKAITI
jgi:hypothetical protein